MWGATGLVGRYPIEEFDRESSDLHIRTAARILITYDAHLNPLVITCSDSNHQYSKEVKIDQANTLIRTPLIEKARPQSWCDLGCGKGTFTTALAQLLAPGSTIYAIDLDQRALDEIPSRYEGVEIRKLVGDLQNSSFLVPSVDGILMANILHFIRDQHTFLKRLLSLTENFLIVEYERSIPTPWGPYPVGFERLRELFKEVGVEGLEKLTTLPSRFGGTMYSAFARKSTT